MKLIITDKNLRIVKDPKHVITKEFFSSPQSMNVHR